MFWTKQQKPQSELEEKAIIHWRYRWGGNAKKWNFSVYEDGKIIIRWKDENNWNSSHIFHKDDLNQCVGYKGDVR